MSTRLRSKSFPVFEKQLNFEVQRHPVFAADFWSLILHHSHPLRRCAEADSGKEEPQVRGALCSAAQSCPPPCSSVDCSLQAPPSPGSSRQEHWSGVPFPTPGGLPYPGSKPVSLGSVALVGGFFSPPGKPRFALNQPNRAN